MWKGRGTPEERNWIVKCVEKFQRGGGDVNGSSRQGREGEWGKGNEGELDLAHQNETMTSSKDTYVKEKESSGSLKNED